MASCRVRWGAAVHDDVRRRRMERASMVDKDQARRAQAHTRGRERGCERLSYVWYLRTTPFYLLGRGGEYHTYPPLSLEEIEEYLLTHYLLPPFEND